MKQKFFFFTRCAVICSLVCLFGSLSTSPALAQVYINEYMPSPASGNEWVELRNMANEEIPLVGWRVQDSKGFLKTLPDFEFAEPVIPPFGYYVFEIKNKLNNDGDTLTIKDSTGWIIGHVIYEHSSPTQSWSFNDELHDYVMAIPTPGADNDFTTPAPSPEASPLPSPSPVPSPSVNPAPSPLPTPVPTPFASPTPSPQPSPTPGQSSQSLQLSEVVACPASGEPEWVEIYNPNSYQISLHSWKFKDKTGNTKTFSTDLSAQGYQVVEITSSLLNNDGDSLAVLDQSGAQVTYIELPACVAGQSTVYTQNGWQQTTQPTPFAGNIFHSAVSSSPSPTPYTMSYQLTAATEDGGTTTPNASADPNTLLLADTEGLATEGTADLGEVLGLTEESFEEPLPQLLPLESPVAVPVQQISSTHENTSTAIPPRRRIISKFALAALFLFSMSCCSLSGYLFYQWYTEQRAKVLLEDL